MFKKPSKFNGVLRMPEEMKEYIIKQKDKVGLRSNEDMYLFLVAIGLIHFEDYKDENPYKLIDDIISEVCNES